jgi:hypothetical protein
LIGPAATKTATINSLYKRGMHLRRSSLNKISNAVIMGWPRGIRLDGTNTIAGAIDGSMYINNTIIAGWTSSALDTVSAGGQTFDAIWYTNSGGRTYPTNAE